MIPVNSIEIPERFVALASEWYGSINCKLYAVASTGGLTLGNRIPVDCTTTEEWYYSIWCDLSYDISYTRKLAGGGGVDKTIHEDYDALVEFEAWVETQVDRLAESYGIE